MDIPVLVEQVGTRKYVAKCGEPFGLCAEGDSHFAAVNNLEELLRKKLAGGVRLDSIELPEVHPLARVAGTLDPDDPATHEYLQAIQDYRRQVDAEDEATRESA
jgi:hypothetical protein